MLAYTTTRHDVLIGNSDCHSICLSLTDISADINRDRVFGSSYVTYVSLTFSLMYPGPYTGAILSGGGGRQRGHAPLVRRLPPLLPQMKFLVNIIEPLG